MGFLRGLPNRAAECRVMSDYIDLDVTTV